MAQTHEGAMTVLATKAGVTLADLLARQARGEKWCYRCKTWLAVERFVRDRSRYDGRASKCADCRSTKTRPGPSIRERRARRARGHAWCRGCETWLMADQIASGLCRVHAAEYERNRYRTDETYRMSRCHRSAQRKRGVAAIPVEAQISLTEQFGGLCAYCDNPATAYDHLDPVSKGGITWPGYIVPACRSCNSRKKDLSLDEFLEKYDIIAKHELIEVIALQDCWPA